MNRPKATHIGCPLTDSLYDTYPDLDGLYYPSSMHGNRPARRAIPPRPEFHRPLADPALLRMLDRVARDLGYGLV